MLASMAVIPAKAEETVMPLNASRIDSEKLPASNLILHLVSKRQGRRCCLFIPYLS